MKLIMKKNAYVLTIIGFSFFTIAMERPAALNPELQKKFFAAVKNGDLKEVNRLMRFRPQLDINAKNEYGQTPIERAIIGEQPDIVYALLNAGIDPNQRSKGGLKPGDTLLMVAASVGNVEIVQMLLDFGADPYLREEELPGRLGKTAFDLSWRYPAVQKLLKHYEKTKLP